MIIHYFDDDSKIKDDFMLTLCIKQGYVPSTCLLGGYFVMGITREGKDPCKGCEGPRERCHGRSKQ